MHSFKIQKLDGTEVPDLCLVTISQRVSVLAVTGASRGYAFVEFETEKDMRHAYEVTIFTLP